MEGQGSYQLHLSEGFLDTSSGVTVALYAKEDEVEQEEDQENDLFIPAVACEADEHRPWLR